MNFVFACYKESYCVLEYNICLYHCELLLTGVNWVYHLDRFIVLWIFWILYIHITENEFTAFWTLSTSWSRQYSCVNSLNISKVKVGVLRPVQQPGSYWDRSSELPLVGLEPTEVTAYD